MSDLVPSSIRQLVEELGQLPGVGEKTAFRYAVSLMKKGSHTIANLERSLSEVRTAVTNCPNCHFWQNHGECSICLKTQRNNEILCVVRDCPDVLSIEKFRQYPWRYHVLHGLLSPLNGIGVHDIHLDSLFRRIEELKTNELILAFDATVEGDATSLYICNEIKQRQLKLKITRMSQGLPAGSSVEYLDASTVESALDNRISLL